MIQDRSFSLKSLLIFISAASLALFSSSSLAATTIRVPSDQPTIQAGIDAADDGDTVLVADGTYSGSGNTNLSFKTRRITLKSENGPSACIIDGENKSNGFYFDLHEEADSVLSGFTITNCKTFGNGSAINCYTSPTITNCIITKNTTDDYGGGIYIYSSSPNISDCIISQNKAGYSGGGIYCAGGTVANITRCTITGNESGWDGGGIYCFISSPTITNCLINANSANYGGGIGFASAAPGIINSTITANLVDLDGGGVYCHWATPTFTNCIVWGNARNEFYIDEGTYNRSPIISYSDIRGGYSGEGNIDSDPEFVGKGNYRLTSLSPCIDTATANGAPNKDIDGTSRPQGFGYDMGAYEYEPPCPDCSGTEVTLTNETFPPNKTCECIGSVSIEIGPGIIIPANATVTFIAPTINVKPGFHAETGAVVNMRQE